MRAMQFEWIQSGSERLATAIDLPAGDGPWPTVVMVHGLTGHRLGKSYHLVEFARGLSASGIACVRFDQAGCGESTGAFQDLTIPRMAADTLAVVHYLQNQSWCDTGRLGMVGISLGALPTVAVDAQVNTAAVALWAPVFDMPHVFSLTARTGLRGILDGQGWVPYRGLRIGKSFVDQLDAIQTPGAVAASSAPLLLLHSRSDAVVPFDQSEAYAQACQETGRPHHLESFNTADHDFADYQDRQRLLTTTTQFFTKHLTYADND